MKYTKRVIEIIHREYGGDLCILASVKNPNSTFLGFLRPFIIENVMCAGSFFGKIRRILIWDIV